MTTRRLSMLSLAAAFTLAACTPQQHLLWSLVPDGTTAIVLGNLEKVSDENRKRVAALEQAGRWEELDRFAQENIVKDRTNPDWWLVAGYARTQLGQHAAAADALGNAARLEPDNIETWNLLAQAYRSAGEPHRAVNVLNNALLAAREAPMTLFLLGESYSDLRRYTDAAAAYREAVRLDERFSTAWFALARTYAQLGRTDDAREAQSRLEKLDPKLAARLGEGTGVREGISAREAPAR